MLRPSLLRIAATDFAAARRRKLLRRPEKEEGVAAKLVTPTDEEVITEKIVEKEVEKAVPVEVIKEVIKEVPRIVEVPLLREVSMGTLQEFEV